VRPAPARVVILGGGFAGIYAASYLAAADLPPDSLEVIMVSDRNYFTFTPLLAEVIAGSLGRKDVTLSLPVFANRRGFRFIQARVEGVGTAGQTVTSTAGDIEYDFLVLGLGAGPKYFGNRDLERHSISLTSVRDALALRERVIGLAEAASRESSADRRRRMLTFCVAGAGPAGVEGAAEVWHLVRSVLPRYYDLGSEGRVIILQGSEGILPGWNEDLARSGLAILRRRGIEVSLGSHVRGYDGRVVSVDTSDGHIEIEADTLVWTAGTAPCGLVWSGTSDAVRPSGHIATDRFLRVVGTENVYAAGDAAFREDPRTGRPYPAVAPIAISQGIRAAGNIENAILGRALEPYHAHHAGSIVSLGHGSALVDVLGWTMKGRLAWALYRTAYLLKLVGARNKLRAATSLALGRVFEPDITCDYEPTG